MTKENLIKELKKEIIDLKELLSTEKAINLHKYPKINLKKGDYFTGELKSIPGSYQDTFFKVEEIEKINPERTMVSVIYCKKVFNKNTQKYELKPEYIIDDPWRGNIILERFNIYKYKYTPPDDIIESDNIVQLHKNSK